MNPQDPPYTFQKEHYHHKAALRRVPLCILAHDIESPRNVGSLFRMADAFGLSRLYLTGSTPIPPNRKITRSSRSTDRAVPFESSKNPLEILQEHRARDDLIACLEHTHDSVPLHQFFPSQNLSGCLLIVGAERRGVPDVLIKAADHSVHIPMRGRNSSMNLAMAAGIATYTLLQHFEIT